MLFGTYYRFIKYIIDDMAWLRRILGICKKTQNKTVEGNQVTVKHRQVYIYINYTNYLDMEEGTQNHKPVEALLPRLQCQMSGPF